MRVVVISALVLVLVVAVMDKLQLQNLFGTEIGSGKHSCRMGFAVNHIAPSFLFLPC